MTDHPFGQPEDSQGPVKLLTITSASRRLGVSPRIVRELIATNELGSYAYGRHIRVAEADVESYLIRAYRPALVVAS